MKRLNPFNLKLYWCTPEDVRYLRETRVTDIYDGMTSNFHEDGLFSTTTFGRVGTPERDNVFSYIRLNTSVIHPMIYDTLVRLRRFYREIMMGQAYAIFNPETRDFEASDMFEGETGISFFIKYLPDLEPNRTRSKRNQLYNDIIDKYKKNCLMSNCLVIPAGFRDLTIDAEGNELQDEVNDLYRKLISIANSINLVGTKFNDTSIDQQRKNIQLTMFEIYTYFETMIEGKKGVIQSKWGGRRVAQGTRNVISSMETLAQTLHDERAPDCDHIQIGLLQTMKGAMPITTFNIRNKFLQEVFLDATQPTYLINRKTLKLEQVYLDPYVWDKWGTTAGLEKVIDGFSDDRLRNKPILINNYYLYLVYRKGNKLKLFRNIDDLPKGYSREDVHPLTYSELFYLSNYEGWYNLRALVTRYPINNMYSIYPAKVYTKTTLPAEDLYELGDDWVTTIGRAKEYPILDLNAAWLNSACPNPCRLAGLAADFDGDWLLVNDDIQR